MSEPENDPLGLDEPVSYELTAVPAEPKQIDIALAISEVLKAVSVLTRLVPLDQSVGDDLRKDIYTAWRIMLDSSYDKPIDGSDES